MVHARQVVTQADATTEVKEEETELTKEESPKREEKFLPGAFGLGAIADKILGRDKRQVS